MFIIFATIDCMNYGKYNYSAYCAGLGVDQAGANFRGRNFFGEPLIGFFMQMRCRPLTTDFALTFPGTDEGMAKLM